ncbi:CapA family protein [Mesorhizobium retamae]|uniref:CapA family protein n=1 Tax=Mesorhizobium retamae TaxID=2912854 RepID=A0ABS9QMG0_9HYPH|nr:CapA family protein [Mesorhizobium sp. IRAMC:0171]MCG7508625.1 CapA family protein [Mesorhizobium sp. IRAMC:0171]
MKDSFCVAVTGQSLLKSDVRHVRHERFLDVLDFLKQGDVVFTNFESTILGRYGGWPTKGKYFDYSRPEMLDALQAMGFNALALANNHAFDLGPAGVLSTLGEVWSRGFLHAGIGTDETDAMKPGRQRLGDRDVSLFALDAGPGADNMYAENRSAARPARPGVNRLKTVRKLGVTEESFRKLAKLMQELRTSALELTNYAQPDDPTPVAGDSELNFYGTVFKQGPEFRRLVEIDPDNASEHLSAIRRAAERGDFVIAYLHHHHWEPGWQDVPGWVQGFARACVDAGANLFVSHGAPVLQAMEIYNGAPLFYGLGNFLFHVPAEETEWSAPEVWRSVVAACRYGGSGTLESIDLLPVVIGGEEKPLATRRLVPLAATGEVARDILQGFAVRSRVFGTEIAISGSTGRVFRAPKRKFG